MAARPILPARHGSANAQSSGLAAGVPDAPKAPTRRQLLHRARKFREQRDSLLKDARRYRDGSLWRDGRPLWGLYLSTLKRVRQLHRQALELVRQAGGHSAGTRRRIDPAMRRHERLMRDIDRTLHEVRS